MNINKGTYRNSDVDRIVYVNINKIKVRVGIQ